MLVKPYDSAGVYSWGLCILKGRVRRTLEGIQHMGPEAQARRIR
jgi:hypothetical protein